MAPDFEHVIIKLGFLIICFSRSTTCAATARAPVACSSRQEGPDERGWFRTGDAATVDPHGWITVVDRIKDVIISGGENVFCPEVEDVLRGHPRVSKAAVYGVPDALLGELVEAAVTLRDKPSDDTAAGPHSAVTERDLRAHCSASLAQFKVPHRIVLLARDSDMPTTSTGKIQKKRLRETALLAAAAAAADAAAARRPRSLNTTSSVGTPINTSTAVGHAVEGRRGHDSLAARVEKTVSTEYSE